MTSGEAIRARREELGLGTRELARKAMISHSNIVRWEEGESIITTDKVIKLAQILDCTTDYLLGMDIKSK